ncbi:MAG: hypothetical protein JWR19_2515 [Pedosphaera sp.]|nr:hypothetical protein [Pedosphaera sp.]
MAGSANLTSEHVSEAIQYRSLIGNCGREGWPKSCVPRQKRLVWQVPDSPASGLALHQIKSKESCYALAKEGARLPAVRFPSQKCFDAYPQLFGTFLSGLFHFHAAFYDLLTKADRSL